MDYGLECGDGFTTVSRLMEARRRRLRERLARIEHDQWMAWSQSLAAGEHLSDERLARWRRHWVSYEELSEEARDRDRHWADRVLDILVEEGLLETEDRKR